jgi:hypothetical protein
MSPSPIFPPAVRNFLALLPTTTIETWRTIARMPAPPGFAAAAAHRDQFARATGQSALLRAIEDDVARHFDELRRSFQGGSGAPLQELGVAQFWTANAATALAITPEKLGPLHFDALYTPFRRLIPLTELEE